MWLNLIEVHRPRDLSDGPKRSRQLPTMKRYIRGHILHLSEPKAAEHLQWLKDSFFLSLLGDKCVRINIVTSSVKNWDVFCCNFLITLTITNSILTNPSGIKWFSLSPLLRKKWNRFCFYMSFILFFFFKKNGSRCEPRI